MEIIRIDTVSLMADDDLKKYQDETHKDSDHSAPYPVSRMAPSIKLVDLAKQISQADQMLNTRVTAKLKVIADQIKALQTEARAALEEARQDQALHRAQCNFQRIPGKVYHLYQKDNANQYFSMLSPDDWNGSPPHQYLGSYRLENDMSWTPAENIGKPDDTQEVVKRLLGAE
jgi:hypothetical protein